MTARGTGAARRARAIAVAVVVTSGCHGPPSSLTQGPTLERGEGVLLARMQGWPGGGAELTLRLEDADGFPLSGDRTGDVRVTALTSGQPASAAIRRRAPEGPGYTLILALPGASAADHNALREAIAAFIAARPTGERVALYRWGQTIEQLAGFASDRDDLATVLSRVTPRDPGAALASPTVALMAAVGEARAVGSDAERGMRAVVVIGDALPGPAPDVGGQPVVVQWVLGGGLIDDAGAAVGDDAEIRARLGTGRIVAWEHHGGPGGALAEAAARLDAARDAFYDVGLCDAGGESIQIAVDGEPGALELFVPTFSPEDTIDASGGAAGDCDPALVASGERPYPDTIEFSFTLEQRQRYDQLRADNGREDFDLSVRLWPDGPLVEARAHLRGKGSIGCDRRNFTLNLDGNAPRHLMPGSATDELYVLSMCLDDRYVRAHTVYQLLSRVGVFHSRFRYIELVIDGQSQGVYLLVDKVAEALIASEARVRSVIRRRYSPDATAAEVKQPDDEPGVSAARDAYQSLLAAAAGASGEARAAAMDERMDTRGYITLLAMTALLQNGDHVDEVWLRSVDHLRAGGQIGDWFAFAGWDPDDIFGDCHFGGTYAYPDEFGLSYCAEAELDDAILSDPVLYERYVTRLEALMDEISEQVFQDALDQTGASLLYYIRRPQVAAAMTELVQDVPAAVDPAVAEAEILAELDRLADRFRARRQLLMQRVATYRGATAE